MSCSNENALLTVLQRDAMPFSPQKSEIRPWLRELIHSSAPIDNRFFRPCRSLQGNNLGPAGAEHLSGALKINITLKDLKCAASSQNLPTCTPRPRP